MIRRAKPLLGTFVEIGVKTSSTLGDDSTLLAIKKAFLEIEKIQNLLSFHDAQSELSQLNANPHRWLTLNRHSVNVLRLAQRIGRLSENKFNCTLGGALVMKKVLPQRVTHEFLACGEAGDIEIRGTQVRITKPLLISLDGIAKGYAVDLAVKQLSNNPIAGGWVNAGGDMRIFGDCKLTLHQRQNHQLSEAKTFCNIAVASSRLASAHTTEYPALLLDGRSAKSKADDLTAGEQVITVAASETWRADALTKVAASLDENDRARWISRLGGSYVKFNAQSMHFN